MEETVRTFEDLMGLRRRVHAGELEDWELVVAVIAFCDRLEATPGLGAAFGTAVVREQDRVAALDLLDHVVQFAKDLVVADILDAVDALDVEVTRWLLLSEEYRCVDRLRRLPGRFAAITAKHLVAAHVEGDAETGDWRVGVVRETWGLPPADGWMVMGRLGVNLPEDTDDPGRQSWWGFTFELAPQDVFRADPPARPLPEALDLAEAHAAAYLAAIDRLGGLGDDGVRRWVQKIAYSVPGCGMDSCCRPSLWEAAVLRRGFNPRRPPPFG